MKFVTLGELADFINGYAFKPSDWGDSGKPIIRIQNLTNPEKPYNRTTSKVSQKYVVRPGDILVSWSASLGVFVWNLQEEGLVNQHIFKVIPNNLVDKQYFLHALKEAIVVMEKHLHGATMKHVNRGEFLSTKIPLPPLPEQRRIAAILDKADAIRRKRQRAIALTEEFLRSAFLEMFGDPVTNPKGWISGTINEVVSDPKSDVRCGPFGTQLKVHELVAEGIPLLGIENVHNDRFIGKTEKYLTEEKAKYLSRFDVQSGDVLVTRMGTIGRACVVPEKFGKARISYHLFRVRPNKEKCIPEFLAATICRSGTFQHQLKRLAHGAIMDGLSTSILKEIKFLLPPIELQKRYLVLVRKIEESAAKQNIGLQEADKLFKSLAYRAFQGELDKDTSNKLIHEAAAG